MRNVFFLALFALLTASCASSSFYQVYTMESDLERNSTMMAHLDEDCEVIYDFWAPGGDASFTFFNKTDKEIVLDLSRSFFVKNGIAYDYAEDINIFAPTTTLDGKEGVQSVASSVGNRKAVIVPPHTARVIKGYKMKSGTFYVFADEELSAPRKSSDVVSYTFANSPLRVENRITYMLDGETKVVTNTFFLCAVQNYAYSSIVEEEIYTDQQTKVQCVRRKLKFAAPNKFYNFYNFVREDKNMKHL